MLQHFVGKPLIIETGGWMLECVLLAIEPSLMNSVGVSSIPYMKVRTCRGDIVYLDACTISGFREPSERDEGPNAPQCLVDYCGMWRKQDEDTPEDFGDDGDSGVVEEAM